MRYSTILLSRYCHVERCNKEAERVVWDDLGSSDPDADKDRVGEFCLKHAEYLIELQGVG
jgi:hypothetical protein